MKMFYKNVKTEFIFSQSLVPEYLRDSRLSISQIADEMNFTSVSYFSRYCKKHTGMSPAQFRLAGAKP